MYINNTWLNQQMVTLWNSLKLFFCCIVLCLAAISVSSDEHDSFNNAVSV